MVDRTDTNTNAVDGNTFYIYSDLLEIRLHGRQADIITTENSSNGRQKRVPPAAVCGSINWGPLAARSLTTM